MFTIVKTLPPSCNEDVNLKYKFNGPHDPCEITQINITQWHVDLECSMSTNVLN